MFSQYLVRCARTLFRLFTSTFTIFSYLQLEKNIAKGVKEKNSWKNYIQSILRIAKYQMQKMNAPLEANNILYG